MSTQPGRLEVHKNGVLVGSWAVWPDSGLLTDVDGLMFTFVGPSAPPPVIGPPRELSDMSLTEVAEYLVKRIESEEYDRRWEGVE